MKEKKEKYLEEERRTEQKLFRKNFEKIVLLNNETFYWTLFYLTNDLIKCAKFSLKTNVINRNFENKLIHFFGMI